MLSVPFSYSYAVYHYAECHYAECRIARIRAGILKTSYVHYFSRGALSEEW
jgi:hypothetical protein